MPAPSELCSGGRVSSAGSPRPSALELGAKAPMRLRRDASAVGAALRRSGQLSWVASTQAKYSGVTEPVTYSPVKQLISSDSTEEPSMMAACMSATSW